MSGTVPRCDGSGRGARGAGASQGPQWRNAGCGTGTAPRTVGVSKGTSLIHSHLWVRRCGLTPENLPAPREPPGSPVRVCTTTA